MPSFVVRKSPQCASIKLEPLVLMLNIFLTHVQTHNPPRHTLKHAIHSKWLKNPKPHYIKNGFMKTRATAARHQNVVISEEDCPVTLYTAQSGQPTCRRHQAQTPHPPMERGRQGCQTPAEGALRQGYSQSKLPDPPWIFVVGCAMTLYLQTSYHNLCHSH